MDEKKYVLCTNVINNWPYIMIGKIYKADPKIKNNCYDLYNLDGTLNSRSIIKQFVEVPETLTKSNLFKLIYEI